MSSGRLHPLVMAVSTCLSVKALQTQIYIIAPLLANDYQKHLITASIFLFLWTRIPLVQVTLFLFAVVLLSSIDLISGNLP